MNDYKKIEALQQSLLEIATGMSEKYNQIQTSSSYINDRTINTEALGANIQAMLSEYMKKAQEAFTLSSQIMELSKEQNKQSEEEDV